MPDRVAVITGAASGIGRALARAFAARGTALALCDLDETGLAETASTCTVPLITARVDVADAASVAAFAERTLKELGGADLVINNAGVTTCQTFIDMTRGDFEWVMNVDFWGVVNGCRAFLPHLLERGSGHLVNISSIFGIIGYPTQSAYCAAKFAVRGFTESLRQELKGTGVAVVCVHPGGIRTNIVRRARFYKTVAGHDDHATFIRRFEAMAGTSPERAAEAILTGIAKGRSRIRIGADAHLLDRVARLFPSGYARIIDYLSHKGRNRHAGRVS